MRINKLKAVDLFCGAGGTTNGVYDACDEIGLPVDMLAINHWDVAVATHSKNHPDARHLCESVDNVDPRKQIPGGRLNLLVASPECTHHSLARGGRPMSDQSRASAWHIVRWAEALYIDNILVENVKEFKDWGPLGINGRPVKSKKGETFQAFIRALESLNYTVEYRILNAADYGDATTRHRLFVQARKKPRKIVWPEPSHRKASDQDDMFDDRPTWRSAREIIDWNIPGKSIFNRKKPLAANTLARIAAGLQKFGGNNAEPFLVILRNHGADRSIDQPVSTLIAGGNHIGLCEPFVLGQQSGATPRSVDQPLPTIATAGAISLVEPFLMNIGGPTGSGRTDNRTKDLDRPLPTQDTSNRFGLVEPLVMQLNHKDDIPRKVSDPMVTVTATSADFGLVEPFLVPFFGEREGQEPRCQSVDSPLPTVTSHGAGGLVEPFLTPLNHGAEDMRAYSVNRPLPTVTSADTVALIEPFIVPLNHGEGDTRSHSIEDPMPTITSVDAWSVIEPFLAQFNGTATVQDIHRPMGTITAKDRFGLVQTYGLDIRFRMLQPRELANAMSLPETYEFTGSGDIKVKQIGNSVPRRIAKALTGCLIAEYAVKQAAA